MRPIQLCIALAALAPIAAVAQSATPRTMGDQLQQACPAGSTGVGSSVARDSYRPGSILPGAQRSQTPPSRAARACTTFENAQWARFDRTADAAVRIAAAAATQQDTLGALERDRRRLAISVARASEERALVSTSVQDQGARAAQLEPLNRQIDEETARIAQIEARIEAEYPRYAGVVRPQALPIPAVRELLREGEAMVQFLVNADATYVWVVTRDQIVWRRVAALPRAALEDRVRRLRAMLADPRVESVTGDRGVTFDGQLAYSIYRDLLGGLEGVLAQTTTLFVVPDGPLTSVPLGVLLTADPGSPQESPFSAAEILREANWLSNRFGIAMLPSVSALRSLRCFDSQADARRRPAACPRFDTRALTNLDRMPRRAGAFDFVGIGDPVLLGANADRAAPPPLSIGSALGVAAARPVEATGLARQALTLDQGSPVPRLPRIANPASLRSLERLRGTEAELLEILGIFNAGERRRAMVLLGAEAVEPTVRGPDGTGVPALQDALYISFATHGLLSGETALGAAGLVMTPPADADATETNDGLLSAPEIAQMRLRARLVVLSACNTADETGRPTADGLPGLASAIFLAGARGVLVSHWAVSDASTARLVADMFARIDAAGDAPGGRLAAYQAAMAALRTGGPPAQDGAMQPDILREAWAHPAYWAPFSYIGDPG